MKPIEEYWNSYRAILPKDAGATQIIETRRAFYAGAEALYAALMRGWAGKSAAACPLLLWNPAVDGPPGTPAWGALPNE